MLAVLWLGGLGVIDGTLTLGAFVAFNLYLIRMSRPMYLLGRMVEEFQRAAASLGRIGAVLDHPPEDRGAQGGHRLRGEIELRDVHLAFDGRGPVLDGVSLRVPAGDTLAIVGRVGSGKSTLARLIPRLLQPDRGQVPDRRRARRAHPAEDPARRHRLRAAGGLPVLRDDRGEHRPRPGGIGRRCAGRGPRRVGGRDVAARPGRVPRRPGDRRRGSAA